MFGLAQMTEIFSSKIDCNVLNHIGMVRSFCGYPVIDCYQDGLLSSTHVLV